MYNKYMNKYSIIPFIIGLTFLSCGESNSLSTEETTKITHNLWDAIKSNTKIDIALSDEYSSAHALSIANLGWEDGLQISRDGLHLYATYMPADLLSFTLNSNKVEELYKYQRSDSYDMDFSVNPTGQTYKWFHSDIIYSSREALDKEFTPWKTSNMKRAVFSEGGVSTVFSDKDNIEMMAYTSNEFYESATNIHIIKNTSANPSGEGQLLSPIDTLPCDNNSLKEVNTNCIEDNPHLEKLSSDNWVLFFDSENRPGAEGSHDLWYSTSTDNASTWSIAKPVSSINTSSKEHQPHLYNDGTSWWLYYSAYDSDAKLAIFRAKQEIEDDWDSWGTVELVLSAGNSAGIGEPTLSDNGDLYFIVITKNETENTFDQYDADPWVLIHK